MRPTLSDGVTAGPLLLQAIHVVMDGDIVHYKIPASVVIAVQVGASRLPPGSRGSIRQREVLMVLSVCAEP